MSPVDRVRVPDVARVEAQLAELWRDTSGEGDPLTRACTLNLVVVCADDAGDLQAATDLVAQVSETEPGRALVVSFPDDGRRSDGMEAFVSAHCHLGRGGKQICSEQITLEARGAGRELIPATVLQLLEGELPVYTLWRREQSRSDPLPQALLALSDRFIVNSGNRRDPARALEGLERISRSSSDRGRAADLTWERVECWRDAVASFFDAPVRRPGLERITALAFEGGGPTGTGDLTAAAAYLAGWLASRLDWSDDASGTWRRPDGAPVEIAFASARHLPSGDLSSVRIETVLDGSPAALVARRTDPSGNVVSLSVETAGSCPLPSKIELPVRDDAALLCGLLQRSRKDPLFDAALGAAARLR